MVDAVITFALENVSRLLTSHVDLICGAENELNELQKEFRSLKAFLQDAAHKTKKNEFFREMERQIRDVVYEVEDTIDIYLTKTTTAKDKDFFRRQVDKAGFSLPKMVKSLREEKVKPMLDKVFKEFTNMQMISTNVDEPRIKLKKVELIREDNIVGFQDEEETMTSYIMEPKEELDVISIIGMPGLGKTTLAWKIYKNNRIQREFPICIWVCVSEVFNMKDVLLNILKKFTNQDMSKLSEQDLAESVRGNLMEGKFLLFLDDVWSVDAWDSIKTVLPKSNKSGKVVITSRETKVGMHANPIRGPHNLRFLMEDESWELLRLEVFGRLDDCPQELEGIGELIAHQCDGLPLAIVIIGGVLLDHLSSTQDMDATENAWKKVSENVDTILQNDKDKRISDIVALSYNRLPDDLRDCFIYLGVFPEDYEIPAWTLTRLWIGEGFIQYKTGKSLEETAMENLKDLTDRNLVMIDKTSPDGKVKTCRVHDMIRAFCCSRAAMTEQNLFQEIRMFDENIFHPPTCDIEKYRRLCIHSHLQEFLAKEFLAIKKKGPGVRSFLCFYKANASLDPKYKACIADAFKLLRVWDSKTITFKQFPQNVGQLIHLRYITLSGDDFGTIPEALSGLWNLQTLLIQTNSRSLTIKANIWKMIHLRHLKTKAAVILAIKNPREGEGGENLQTLSRLSPDDCTEEVFDKAPNLKRLWVRGKLATLFGGKALEKLCRLEKLKLVNDLYYGQVSTTGLPRFPPCLKRLTLSATFLNWTNMSVLGDIPTLEVLKLKDNAFTGRSWSVVGDRDGFRRLHFLLIADTDLFFWEVRDDHFPRLRSLVVMNCENLGKIPLSLAKSLEKLDIDRLQKSAVESAREIEKAKSEIITQGQSISRWRRGFKLTIGPGCDQS